MTSGGAIRMVPSWASLASTRRASSRSQITRAEAGLVETAAQLKAEADQRAAEISQEQRQVRDRLVEIEERLREAHDVATRREIVAPISGTVLNLRFFTIGGVVRAGQGGDLCSSGHERPQ